MVERRCVVGRRQQAGGCGVERPDLYLHRHDHDHPGANGSISGTSSGAIELKYVGDGMFAGLSHEGSLTSQ
jgi:hypothetical protein